MEEVEWSKIQALCEERQLHRLSRDWAEADRVKERLLTLGVELSDDNKAWTHTESGASGNYEMKDTKAKHGPTGNASIPKNSNHTRTEKDWECKECQNVNWGHRFKCNRCGEARPVSDELVLTYKEQRAAEGQMEKDEANACDRAFNRAREERRKAEEEMEKAAAERLRQMEEHAARHPTPLITKDTLASKKKAKVEVTKPPEPKTGDAAGAARLKRVREDLMKKKEQDAKKQKVEKPNKVPVTLDNMDLSIAAENRERLVKNVRILAKVAAAKRQQLRKHERLRVLLTEVAQFQLREAPKDVVVIQDHCCKVAVELLNSPQEPDKVVTAQWLRTDAACLMDLAEKSLKSSAENVKVVLSFEEIKSATHTGISNQASESTGILQRDRPRGVGQKGKSNHRGEAAHREAATGEDVQPYSCGHGRTKGLLQNADGQGVRGSLRYRFTTVITSALPIHRIPFCSVISSFADFTSIELLYCSDPSHTHDRYATCSPLQEIKKNNMSAPTPFVSNVKQFSQHTKLDKMNGIPTVRPLKQPVRAINGDTPEVRSIYVNERMKELGVRCMEQFSVENTVAVGGVSQDAQKHLVRVKNMDKDDVNWVRVEGCKEKYGVSDVTLDRRATPYSMYPGKVFGLTGEFKYHGQGTIKGVRVTNPTPLMSSGAKKEADFAEAMHAKKKPRTEGTAPANESSFKMMVAAGPFDQSLSKSLQYVKRLIHHSNARGTGALLIVGPLSLERDSDDVGFLEEDDTLSYFPEELKGKKPQLIFVPSLDDPFNEYVYPQPGYTFDSTEGVFSLNNPGRFNINGVDVAVTSLDVLKALRQDMTHNVGSDTNVGVFSPYDASDPTSMKPAQKMALDEILAAGSLYPSLPPNSSVPLDVSLAEHLTFTSSTPDVLILPALQPFAEAVILNERDRTDKVVALNPGNFTSPVNRNKHQFMEVTVTRVPNQKKPIWEQVSVEWLDLEALDKK